MIEPQPLNNLLAKSREDRIRELAEEIHASRHNAQQPGTAEEDWLQAERQIDAQDKQTHYLKGAQE